MHQDYPNFEWAPGEVINDEVDEEVLQEILIVDVFGNVDNDENEVLDILVAENEIEIDDNLDIIEEDEE